MMRLMPDGSLQSMIERQEIADLVEVALELEAGSLRALAARLEVSPSSIRPLLAAS